jgi:hypothetical protein
MCFLRSYNGLRTDKISRMLHVDEDKIILDSFSEHRHIPAIITEGDVRRQNAPFWRISNRLDTGT